MEFPTVRYPQELDQIYPSDKVESQRYGRISINKNDPSTNFHIIAEKEKYFRICHYLKYHPCQDEIFNWIFLFKHYW
jgi:hypothetical protein